MYSHSHFRFQTEHVTRSIPLSNVNESSAAMLEDGGIEADLESFYKHLFLIQDLYASGYRMADVGPDENGLVNNCNLIESSWGKNQINWHFSTKTGFIR